MDHVSPTELEKYLKRGMSLMPWTELSQKDFLEHVVPGGLIVDQELLDTSKEIMAIVVQNPGRLLKSAFHARLVAAVADSSLIDEQQIDQQQSFTPKMMSPGSPRRRKSTNEIREIQQQQQQQQQQQRSISTSSSTPSSTSATTTLSRTNSLRRSLNDVKLRMDKLKHTNNSVSGNSAPGSKKCSFGDERAKKESNALPAPPPLQPKSFPGRVLNQGVTSFTPTAKASQQEDLLFIE